MKRVNIGYIYYSPTLSEEDKLFLKIAKKKNINLIMFNLTDKLVEKEIEDKAKQCDLIFNDSGEYIAMELVKSLEELGKIVIDASEVYYYTEDKWMFFLKCKEHNFPTPETILLSNNLNSSKQELEDFGHWPIILKRVYGERGEFVKKAKNVEQAVNIIKEFWKKGNERLPIIAQEFIKSPCYRVMVIGNKIVQCVKKESKGWKATGTYTSRFKRFKIDNDLNDLIKKLVKICKIKICGIDFLKKEDKWYVLEINAEPSFKFFDCEKEKMISYVLDFLKKECK